MEVKVESPEDKQLEPLLILEEGDEPSDAINSRERGRTVLRVKKSDEDKGDHAVRGDARNDVQGTNDSQVTGGERHEDAVNPGRQREGKVEGCENINKMDGRLSKGTEEKMAQDETQEPDETDADMSSRDKATARADVKLRPKHTLSPDDAKLTVRTPNDDRSFLVPVLAQF